MEQVVFLAGIVASLLLSVLSRIRILESNNVLWNFGVFVPVVGAVASAVIFYIGGGAPVTFSLIGEGIPLGVILIDQLSILMSIVVSIIAGAVARFSVRYLDGNPRKEVFLGRLLVTLAPVQLLIIAGDLVTFFAAWLATSISLHGLLLFFPDRRQAQACARKKFFISRLGDAALLGATILTVGQCGSVVFAEIAQCAGSGPAWEVNAIAVLLAIGALTKSAQFPFHSWLPESLETPTPVSALMHAGIINSGGYLILRLSFLFSQSSVALGLLAIIGCVTAVLGMSAMVTQTSIKKRLAYSTIGQMGFMTLQCGLGFFQLALVHMVAHAFYKAYAFLRSGSAVDQRRREAFYPSKDAMHGAFGVLLFLACGAVLVLSGKVIGSFAVAPGISETAVYVPVLLSILTAVVHGSHLHSQRFAGTIAAAAIGSLLWIFSVIVGALFPDQWVGASINRPDVAPVVSVLVLLVLIGAFVVQLFTRQIVMTDPGRRFFVHLHNGFYIGPWIGRLAAKGLATRS